MTTNKPMKLSEVVKALEDGETVEFRNLFKSPGPWSIFDIKEFDRITRDYDFGLIVIEFEFRLKQKPMEIWVNFPDRKYKMPDLFLSKESAIKNSYENDKRVAVHFREVISE